ncbi:MAG TPA: head-tail adaptor protein [Brevundimonas sp.]|nr:head-tail adaptor protein [Brevundimonas sp.]
MPKPKGAGDLRQRVKFQRRPIAGDDGYGNPEGDFVDLGIARAASLAPTRGGEDVQAGRVAGKASWDCWVRQDSGTRQIMTSDRVVDARDGTRVFNIRFIGDMDGDGVWLLMQLESGVAT